MSDAVLTTDFYRASHIERSPIKKWAVVQVSLLHAAVAVLLLNSWSQSDNAPLAIKTMNIQMFTLAKPVEKKPISPTPIIKPEPVKKVEIKADLAPPVVKQDFAFKRVDKEKPKPKPVIKKEIVKAVKEVKPIIAKPKTQTTDSKTTPVKQVIASTTLNRNQHVSADNNPSNKKSVPVSDKAYLPLDKQAPNYPKGALRKGLEGDCTVSYTVNSQGHTESAKVLAGCHPLFKRTSLASAKQFRYEPRMINGKAIAVHNVKNTFEYRIQ